MPQKVFLEAEKRRLQLRMQSFSQYIQKLITDDCDRGGELTIRPVDVKEIQKAFEAIKRAVENKS